MASLLSVKDFVSDRETNAYPQRKGCVSGAVMALDTSK